jgi:hypothetical protein
MEMRDGFAAVRTVVDDQTKAGFLHSHQCSHLGCLQEQMPQQYRIRRCCLADAGDGLLRDEQHVHRRLGINVVKRQHEVVFVNNLCRNLAGDDFLEKGHAIYDFGFTIYERSVMNSVRTVLLPSLHDERAMPRIVLTLQAAAEVLDDLIVHRLAARSPPSCASQVLHAVAQAGEVEELR